MFGRALARSGAADGLESAPTIPVLGVGGRSAADG
jgi:hypothetical protein